jgi:hypothetical protein
MHSGVSGSQNVDPLFFMPGSARCDFHKKRTRNHYSKLVFLHPLGSAGHIVHFGASGCEMSTH